MNVYDFPMLGMSGFVCIVGISACFAILDFCCTFGISGFFCPSGLLLHFLYFWMFSPFWMFSMCLHFWMFSQLLMFSHVWPEFQFQPPRYNGYYKPLVHLRCCRRANAVCFLKCVSTTVGAALDNFERQGHSGHCTSNQERQRGHLI